MADKNARTHTHQSNRAKPKDGKEKKVVFKGVLDNPFRIQWPSIPLNLQNSILAYILELLAGTSEYHLKQRSLSSKRKRETKHAEAASKKKAKITKGADEMDVAESPVAADPKATPAATFTMADNDMSPASSKPEDIVISSEPHHLMHHITFGINAVTKRLEAQVQGARRPTTIIPETETPQSPPPLKYVFVCRADVDPTLLVDHLPHLVAGFNSARPAQSIKLIPLPKGAELALSQALAVRRVTVLAVDIEFSEDAALKSLLESIPVLAASWLTPAQEKPSLVPTHIKLLKTTAPKDMKEARDARAEGKAAAKLKKHARKTIVNSGGSEKAA